LKLEILVSCKRYMRDFLEECDTKQRFYAILFSIHSGFPLVLFFDDSEIGARLEQSSDKADSICGICTNLVTLYYLCYVWL
jgi:hypothetical protein